MTAFIISASILITGTLAYLEWRRNRTAAKRSLWKRDAEDERDFYFEDWSE